MSQPVREFVEVWVEVHVKTKVSTKSTDAAPARVLADKCRAAAKAQGISSRDVDAAIDCMIGGGDGLEAFLTDALEVAADKPSE